LVANSYLSGAKGVAFIGSLGQRPKKLYMPKEPTLKARFISERFRHAVEFDERYAWQ
jgi:hypothetical protein